MNLHDPLPAGSDEERQLLHSWNANAAAWTTAVRQGAIASRRLVTDAAILDLLAEVGSGPILDVGCGEGWLSRALAQRGRDVLGIDASAPLIEQARQHGGARFKVLGYDGLIGDPTHCSGPYAAIVCNFSLLGADLLPLLAALRLRLGANGQLCIQTVHPFSAAGEDAYRDGWRTERFDAFGGQFPAPMPWYFRTVGSWLALLRVAQLDVVTFREPLHPVTGRPASLLLACVAQHPSGD